MIVTIQSVGRRLFEPGQLYTTAGIAVLDINPFDYLARHTSGDWGEASEAERQANDTAVTTGGRLWSIYETPGGRVYVVTSADRETTTFLLPEEAGR